jgi:Radial spokehead-like protein
MAGRCEVHLSEASQEEGATPSAEEAEEGPPLLAPLGSDESLGTSPAWTPLTSSTNHHLKFQVLSHQHYLVMSFDSVPTSHQHFCFSLCVMATSLAGVD